MLTAEKIFFKRNFKVIINNISFKILPGYLLLLKGDNGIGKSTLLRCFMQDLNIDSGKVVWSKNVKIGYFAQNHNEECKYYIPLIDWMAQW